MAENDYRVIGGPHKGEALFFAPDGSMYVAELAKIKRIAGDDMTWRADWSGRVLTADDVYALADQRFVARSLLARCLPLVGEPELRREIKAALEEEE